MILQVSREFVQASPTRETTHADVARLLALPSLQINDYCKIGELSFRFPVSSSSQLAFLRPSGVPDHPCRLSEAAEVYLFRVCSFQDGENRIRRFEYSSKSPLLKLPIHAKVSTWTGHRASVDPSAVREVSEHRVQREGCGEGKGRSERGFL